ncbi:RNA-binding S4 domain-containing protein [Microvirga thermotolerans]|uniref:RNA-binding S4 domain-containing protein n=1 Tax=Microvirga thermotolerans TaxID=2651334 RepID=A0A5P9K2T6_9HYPH|nr:RNA-binding S4 domain-containing protein [Microvirga thermotolerans]QFU18000.1 RNA-binding S4 domain-containing protein [Microvirga thermotolerans]
MREDRQRIDKWLWFARFAKTRTLAAKLVTSGFVRINGQKIENAAKPLAVGDVVTLALARTTLVLRVEGLGHRRGPAQEARLLYADLSGDDGTLVSRSDSG